jgi:hypothetical protein
MQSIEYAKDFYELLVSHFFGASKIDFIMSLTDFNTTSLMPGSCKIGWIAGWKCAAPPLIHPQRGWKKNLHPGLDGDLNGGLALPFFGLALPFSGLALPFSGWALPFL